MLRKLRICGGAVGVFCAVLTAISAQQTANDAATVIARIEAPQVPNRQGLDGLKLTEVMERFHVPGVSVAVIRDFQIHWAKAYGVADAKSGRAVQTDTPFQAASISKPVAAMAALKLVQEKKLALDEDVNKELTTWKLPTTITLLRPHGKG